MGRTSSSKDKAGQVLPTWAPRVRQPAIRRLYETDARGLYDEELIDKVGYALLARCESFIEAMQAQWGKARCPCCSAVVNHSKAPGEVLRCPCGWELPWADYFRTIQHKQLSGAEPVLEQFRGFVSAFPTVKAPREKMLLIDRLIHGFHYFLKGDAPAAPTRPVAVNLIEGRMSEVVAFLETLSYGQASTPGLAETYARWDENIEFRRDWYPSRRDRKP